MPIETMVALYLYVCVCLLIYDLLFIVQSDFVEKAKPKKRLELEALYDQIIAQSKATGCVEPILWKKLLRRLKRTSYLMVFSEMVTENPKMLLTIAADHFEELSEGLLCMTEKYLHKAKDERAFFPYVLRLIRVGDYSEKFNKNIYMTADLLVGYIRDNSVYVRENAIKAIISLGLVEYVVVVVDVLNEKREHQSEKLLTDDLLAFSGDHGRLAAELSKKLEDYCSSIQVIIINYLRLLPFSKISQNKNYEHLYTKLCDENTNKEVKLAVIRYFKKFRYDKVEVILISLTDDEDERSWELAAVSASALQNYPGEAAFYALEKAVSSQNWYVRFNASDTLISWGVDIQKMIVQNKDQYADEMMKYRKQIEELKTKSKEAV